jgi:hypothetical protein
MKICIITTTSLLAVGTNSLILKMGNVDFLTRIKSVGA